jgi:chorismate mutase/prephenate dehydratase
MAKKKSRTKPAGNADAPGRIRQAIDRLDQQILDLANQRAALESRHAERRRAAGKDADVVAGAKSDAERLDRLVKRNPGPLSQRAVRAVFRELASGSRAVSTARSVAFLGPLHSYSHQASIARFGHDIDLIPVGSIGSVFEEVRGGTSDFGLVPMENSTDGRIADTLDNFARSSAEICGEVQLRIHHMLAARCPRSAVNVVYSRPQALSQCRNWLAKHVPSAQTREVTSTSRAAELAATERGAAAVASAAAAASYGLDVLVANIEDNPTNVTRFAVICRCDPPASGEQDATAAKPHLGRSGRTGDDKTTLMFELAHECGVLADAIAVFKRNKVSLTWIESFPMSGRQGGYLFFVELEGHRDDTKVRRALASLERKAVRMEVLGSYARMPVED